MKNLSPFKISKSEFLKQSLHVNQTILRTVAFFSAAVELFNIIRVLFLSNSGLGTLNNRIYFGYYLALFLCAAVFLVLDYAVKMSAQIRHGLYMSGISFFLLWQTLFNIYDIYHSNAFGNITVVTAMVGFSSLVVMKPLFAVCNLAVNYLVFVVFLASRFSFGEVVNFTITALVCMTIYMVRYRHLCKEIAQSQKIEEMDQKLAMMEHEFLLTREQYDLIRKTTAYITFEWDVHQNKARFSSEWRDCFGYPQDIPNFSGFVQEIQRITQEQKEEILQCMENLRRGAHFQKRKLLLPLQTGEMRWFEIYVIMQADIHGKPMFGIGSIIDISSQMMQIAYLEEAVQMDTFMGVLNKTAIENLARQKLEALQSDERLFMIILDLDNFKAINDSFGHPVGDYVLKSVSDLMKQCAPDGIKVGRIGGDEFVAILTDRDSKAFLEYTRRLIREVGGIQWQGQLVGASCSVGVSEARTGGWTYEKLYEASDQALYQAKRAGKNQLCYCGPDGRFTLLSPAPL
ncbi:MAG TPA: GGDEF domain-containing protein [Candidatus Faecousia intestinigallinarum]|nr:GGDEF domain-containing protein [Candidatus Faecousia intestinigallinarum]